MPLDYVFHSDRQLTITIGSGVVTDEELVEHWQKGYADNQIPWGAPEFLDLRTVERFEVTSVGLKKLVVLDERYARDQDSPSRFAIVVSSDHIFGMMRMD